jgi:undecaprenyl-diphosphatase
MSATGLQLAVSVAIAFVIGYAAVAWLLRFLTHHAMYWFVGYRIVLALTVMALLVTGVVAAS